jgi:hypothetical protein
LRRPKKGGARGSALPRPHGKDGISRGFGGPAFTRFQPAFRATGRLRIGVIRAPSLRTRASVCPPRASLEAFGSLSVGRGISWASLRGTYSQSGRVGIESSIPSRSGGAKPRGRRTPLRDRPEGRRGGGRLGLLRNTVPDYVTDDPAAEGKRWHPKRSVCPGRLLPRRAETVWVTAEAGWWPSSIWIAPRTKRSSGCLPPRVLRMQGSATKPGRRATDTVVVPAFRPAQSGGVAERQPDGDRQDERQRDEQGEGEPDHQSPLASHSATNIRTIGSSSDSTVRAFDAARRLPAPARRCSFVMPRQPLTRGAPRKSFQ